MPEVCRADLPRHSTATVGASGCRLGQRASFRPNFWLEQVICPATLSKMSVTNNRFVLSRAASEVNSPSVKTHNLPFKICFGDLYSAWFSFVES